jgi:16S rRNA (adenine1518-N6/adenine1519-N6)-dimethyltransferase
MGRPKRRRLGQNFLTDGRVAERIAGLLEPEPKRVLEIGPGRGALTAKLLDRFERVRALELDEGLLPGLDRRFADRGLELRLGDALLEPLEGLLDGGRPWQVAANLPYSVGTAILRRLLPRHDLVTRVVVMLQREVAERVVARPAGSGHGLLALERAAWAEARIAFNVGSGAFRPRPKVISSVVVLDLRPSPHPDELLVRAFSLAAHALTRPRKMVANAAAPRAGAAAFAAAGVDPSVRPGTLALADWVRLAEAIA